MLTVSEAAAILNRMVAEGFLAVLVNGDETAPITGFELVDDWCLATTQQNLATWRDRTPEEQNCLR